MFDAYNEDFLPFSPLKGKNGRGSSILWPLYFPWTLIWVYGSFGNASFIVVLM